MQRRTPKLRLAGILIAVMFATACLWSDGLALRGSYVGPSVHTDELAKLDPMLAGHSVLFLAEDDFAAWELRGTRLAYLTPYTIPSLPISFPADKPFVVGEPADFNTVTTQTLNDFSYVITTRSDFASVPPENWRPVAATRFYQVWARTGLTAHDSTLSGGSAPGAILDCSTPAGQKLSRTHGTALVQVPPIVLEGGDWQGPVIARQPSVSVLTAGMTVTQQVTLPPGRWQVSLQYTSPTSLLMRTSGLISLLPAALEHQGPYWPVGNVTSTGRRLTIQVKVNAPPTLATSRSAVLGNIAFVESNFAPQMVPLSTACGRYVDWYHQ